MKFWVGWLLLKFIQTTFTLILIVFWQMKAHYPTLSDLFRSFYELVASLDSFESYFVSVLFKFPGNLLGLGSDSTGFYWYSDPVKFLNWFIILTVLGPRRTHSTFEYHLDSVQTYWDSLRLRVFQDWFRLFYISLDC